MATNRLYYDDAYLTSFSARVLDCQAADGSWQVLLDQSAFYPTSGGQPHDTGTLGGALVSDVTVDKRGDVWHAVDAPLRVGETVQGNIDWQRRFDHMQQHAGEHMLAGALHRLLGGYTIGLHLGHAFSTIDVTLPDGRIRLTEEELSSLEDEVNREIQQDLPIRCWFPDAEELARLPLRKPPTVSEHIRVVMIGSVECVACGGTHPFHTGEIGLIKILDISPCRGKMRVSFVCGMRAIRDYRMRFEKSLEAARLLSAEVEKLPGAVERTLEHLKEGEYALRDLRRQSVLRAFSEALSRPDTLSGGQKLVRCTLEGADADSLREAANRAVQDGAVALLASGAGDGALVLFSCPKGFPVSMGQLLSRTVRICGGKGGGRGEYAQGAANGATALETARKLLAADLAASGGGQ